MTGTLSLPELEAAATPSSVLSYVSRIYCGRCIPGGERTVTDADLEEFVDTVLAASFPDGFTVLDGAGGWRDHATRRTIREPSVVFEIFHNEDDAGKVYAVARLYKARFGQDAVGVTTEQAKVAFV